MIKIFLVVSIREFVLICYGKLIYRLLKRSKYYDHYLPLCLLIERLSEKNYQLSTRENSLAISGEDVFPGIIFLLRPGTTDLSVFDQVITNGEYNPLIELINRYHESDNIKTIIDAGANIGLSAIFLKKHFSLSRVICIEPDTSNCDQLKLNVKVNKIENEISVLEAALWTDENERLILKNSFRDGGNWARSVGREREFTSGDVQVSSVTLKEIIKKFELQHIDILKMDIEGAEVELFNDEDFMSILGRKVKFIAIEIHDELGGRNVIESKLKACGFELSRIGETNFCFNKAFNCG